MANIAETAIYYAYCHCGYQGPKYFDPEDAVDDAEDHEYKGCWA